MDNTNSMYQEGVCRICGQDKATTMARGHEFPCCDQCFAWVAIQPVHFPRGTVRAGEPVAETELRDLFQARGKEGLAGGSPRTLEQACAAFAEDLGHPLEMNPMTSQQLLALRFAMRGMCVLMGVPYAGRVEEIAETQLARYSVLGTEEIQQ